MKEDRIEIQKLNSNERGLTLVELLVVVTLIGIISVVVASNVFSKGNAAKAALGETKMEGIKQEISRYKLTYSTYPQQLNDLIRPNSQVKSSGRPFIAIIKEDELKDIWGNPYIYKSENEGRTYSITSLGADGVQGGEGADQDVTIRP